MMTFGFTTPIDLLSWIAAVALGAKVIATLVILIVDRDMRDRPGWGSTLWWATKVTPFVAVACLIAIALLRGETGLAGGFFVLGLFVVVAVPLKVRQRRLRIADTRADAGAVR